MPIVPFQGAWTMTPTETRARRERNAITKESHVLRQITDYLTVEGISWFRMNAGEAMVDGRKIRLAPKGTADLLATVPRFRAAGWEQYGWAIPMWIEIKRPKGGRRTPEQVAFAAYMLSIGCLHIWATDVKDVMAVIPPRKKCESYLQFCKLY